MHVRSEPVTRTQIVRFAGDQGHTALTTRFQIAANERIEVTVEHPVHIADLHTRAQVLGHAIGLQDVAADLRTEVDLEFGVFELL